MSKIYWDKIRFLVTNGCNYRCRFCHNEGQSKDSPSRHMSYDNFKTLIDFVKDQDISELCFSGGEPFLNKDLIRMIRYADDNTASDIGCATNLSLITNSQIHELSSTRVKFNIQFPFASDADFRDSTGSGNYMKVVETIKKVQDSGINIGLNSVIQSLDMSKFVQVLEFALENELPLKLLPQIGLTGSDKFKDKISTYRKDIVAQWKEPITQFETMAKETEKILADTYNTINEQCANYDNAKKEAMRQTMIEYFNELQKVNHYDMITFEDVGLNITLASSEKALKEQIREYFDKIHVDLDLINSQEYASEIMVEYNQNGHDASQAIVLVVNRHKAMEEEQRRIEEKAKERQEEQKQFIASNNLEEYNVEEEIVAPEEVIETPEEPSEPPTFTVKFVVTGTKEQLIALREYIEEKGLHYE